MQIKDLKLKHGVILAPMAGFTDHAMRSIAYRHGAEMTVTEMVSAKAVVYGDKKTLPLARIRESDGPCALQLFGSEPEILAHAAKILESGVAGGIPPKAIDINMGCPVPKIFKNGDGSALMRDPVKIERIVHAVSEAVSLPVTVKLRAGIDEALQNAVECALAAEEGGAAAVAVHGRTRVQMYSGSADRKIIRNVKNALHIPVIANGDVASSADAIAMLEETGADGIMVGRAAIGNPHLFSEIIAALEKIPYAPPSLLDKIASAKEELSSAVRDKGEDIAVREARGRIALYLKGFRGAAAFRAFINTAKSKAEIFSALDTIAKTDLGEI